MFRVSTRNSQAEQDSTVTFISDSHLHRKNSNSVKNCSAAQFLRTTFLQLKKDSENVWKRDLLQDAR